MSRPTSRSRPLLAAAATLAVLGAGASLAEPARLVLETTALARETAASTDVVARVRELARSGRPAEAVARARGVLDDPSTGPATRERVRYETLMSLSTADPDASAVGFVRDSMEVAPTVYVRLDEPGHDIVVPAWDARAAARYTERRWREREASAATRALLAEGGDLAAAWRDGNPATRSGMLEALRAAPPSRLAPAGSSLASELSAGSDVAVPALAVATRTADAGLFARALVAAPGPEAIGALREGLGVFGPTERVDILSAALDRPDLASAALLGLAAEAPTDPRAEALLWSRLASPAHGASAAAALARLDTRDVDLRLEDLAAGDGDPRAARWARLALDLRQQRLQGGGR